jgi:tRNA pseudouridine55 synthase
MYHGIIPIYKEAGMTSHDVVFKARKILKMKKIGHTGTLDPDVTGVLPLVLGQATKLTEYMQQKDKTYRAEVTLGISTVTEDASGEVTLHREAPEINEEDLDSILRSFIGEYQQQVPKFSSVKVNGKKLYEYARAGIDVERPVKTVFIREIKRVSELSRDGGTLKFCIDVVCSKGTYIRTLAVDIGKALNLPAHMSYLERLSSCGFDIEQTVTLKKLAESDPESFLQPIESVINEDIEIDLKDEALLFKIKNGQKIYKNDMIKLVGELSLNDSDYIVFKRDQKVLAMYVRHPEKSGQFKPFKMFSIES